MAAIFGHFLKSWEGKFSFQIEDTLSASIPCLFLPIYLAMPQNSETGRRERGGEDVPKARWSLLKTPDAPRAISKRKGICYCQRSGGKGMHRRALILETNAVSARGGRRPRALGWTRRICGWARLGLTPAGMGETDSRAGRIKLWFRLVTGDLQSLLCLLPREGSRLNNWQVAGIFALENNPRVTISIKQFGSKLFLLSFWHNCYPYKPAHQTALCCCVITQLFSAVAFSAIPFPLATETCSSSSPSQPHCKT